VEKKSVHRFAALIGQKDGLTWDRMTKLADHWLLAEAGTGLVDALDPLAKRFDADARDCRNIRCRDRLARVRV
jgi:hypothetical protein